MSEWTPRVALLGPSAETARVSPVLERGGYATTCYESAQVFLDEALRHPPMAVVCWGTVEDLPADDLRQILQHHFQGQECALLLVRDAGPGGEEFHSRTGCTLGAPAEPAEVLKALGACAEEKGSAGGRVPRILVVDDDQNIVLLGSHIVSGLGMIALEAFDGNDAVAKTKKHRPDLILLDINMPGMDGFQVIEAVKADPATNLTPIIMFSARRGDDDKVRALKLGADDYVTKPFSLPELSARIDRLLKRTRTGMSASSTTGLPGSVSIEQVLGDRLRRGAPLGVLYLDIDNFKSFNDRYGFGRGDSVIRQTADLLLDAVHSVGNDDDFVGHIGGDDFVVVTTPDKTVPIADATVAKFDRLVPLYYDRVDREKGFIETTDRKGRPTSSPVMTISIAIVSNEGRTFRHAAEVTDVAAQLKKFAKSRPGSLWVKDQRGQSDSAG